MTARGKNMRQAAAAAFCAQALSQPRTCTVGNGMS